MSDTMDRPLSDDQIEEMLFDLIEEHFDERSRKRATDWFNEARACRTAMLELGLLDGPPVEEGAP
jgi:hypothetical protein